MDREVPPPRVRSGLYQVVVELEESKIDNGGVTFRRIVAHRNQPRGTAEHLAKLILTTGIRLDAIEGTRFLSANRVREVRLMRDEEDWT